MSDKNTFIEAQIQQGVGRLTLNRPSALNALNLTMIEAIAEVLERWRSESLSLVLLESSSTKAFCAGGDIRAIRENTLAGNTQASEAFFSSEYRLNHTLATYPHPVVSLIDGVCMGGGLGLSVHGKFRVVTEKAMLAMPETVIGFFPDVGASYFLSRLAGSMGMYLGLTGHRIDASEAIYSGLGTHLCSSADLPGVAAALMATNVGSIDVVLRKFARRAEPQTSLAQHRSDIDWCFSAPTLQTVRARLTELDSDWSREQQAVLDRASPQSLEVTFDLITRGRERDLGACLRAELLASREVTESHDFVEGVRAALVDKDHRPTWTSEGSAVSPSLEQQTVDLQV